MKQKKVLMEVEGLKKYYPVSNQSLFGKKDMLHAVDDVSFQIYEGETLGVVGESGCGKSTIGRQLVALEKPTDGKVIFKGVEISKMPETYIKKRRTEFQMIFQDTNSSLNPRKNIYEILSEPMLYHKIADKNNIQTEINRLLDMVGLAQNTLQKYPHEFSGGQRQRIFIARALSLKPQFVVCDEPVSALDVSIQAQILNLLVDLKSEMNLTCLFIGHGLGAVRYISDRIAVMYLGKVVEIADATKLFEHPMHPYTKALIDASPIADPKIRDRERIVIDGEIPSPVNPPEGCRYCSRCPYAKEECNHIDSNLRPLPSDPSHLCACIYAEEIKEGRMPVND